VHQKEAGARATVNRAKVMLDCLCCLQWVEFRFSCSCIVVAAVIKSSLGTVNWALVTKGVAMQMEMETEMGKGYV